MPFTDDDINKLAGELKGMNFSNLDIQVYIQYSYRARKKKDN